MNQQDIFMLKSFKALLGQEIRQMSTSHMLDHEKQLNTLVNSPWYFANQLVPPGQNPPDTSSIYNCHGNCQFFERLKTLGHSMKFQKGLQLGSIYCCDIRINLFPTDRNTFVDFLNNIIPEICMYMYMYICIYLSQLGNGYLSQLRKGKSSTQTYLRWKIHMSVPRRVQKKKTCPLFLGVITVVTHIYNYKYTCKCIY